MRIRRTLVGIFGLLTLTASAQAGGHWSVGIGVGVPVYPGPCCWRGPGYYYPYYYRPYTVVVPQPIYVAQPQVVVAPSLSSPVGEPAPTYQPSEPPPEPSNPVPTLPPPRRLEPAALSVAPASVRTVSNGGQNADIDRAIQALSDPTERVRFDNVTLLGRLHSERTIDPLAATLAGDHSAAVREAAARALGIIGSPRCLPALQRAAQADPDHDVRRSAQFAVEIIRAR